MDLNNRYNGIDADLPQQWLDKLSKEMQIDYQSALMWYAWSYRDGSYGHPIHLGEEMFAVFSKKEIEIKMKIPGYLELVTTKVTLEVMIKILLSSDDKVEIIVN